MIICLFLASTSSVFSQQITISGYVADKSSGEYLIGANVFDTTNFNGCITNKYGYYSIKTDKGKIRAIRFSFVGYSKLLPILRTTLGLFLIDLNHYYDDVKQC